MARYFHGNEDLLAIKPINRELARAINTGDGAGVLRALEAGANPNTSVGGQDMLYRAFKQRRRQIFQVLVENGARMQGSRQGREALYLARAGWLDLLAKAVWCGWEMAVHTPEAACERRTVAAELVRQGDHEGLLMLENLGVDIRAGEVNPLRAFGQDENRWRCTLAVALADNAHMNSGRMDGVFDVLFSHPPRDKRDCFDAGMDMATWIRSHAKHPEQVDQMLERARNSPWWTPATTRTMAMSMSASGHNPGLAKRLVEMMPQIVQPDADIPVAWMGSSLLLAALRGCRAAGCTDMAAMNGLVADLLASGADPNERFHGLTMIQHLMVENGRRGGNEFDVLDLLLQAGATMTDVIESPRENEDTFRGQPPISKYWHGGNVAHVMSWEMQVAFLGDADRGAHYMEQLLDRAPGILDTRDGHGRTPLHTAVLPCACIPLVANERHCMPMMQMLLDQGADPMARWKDGNTLLHAISVAWRQGLKPADGNDCLAMLRQRCPELWQMANDEGMTGQEAIEAISAPRVAAGPVRKR